MSLEAMVIMAEVAERKIEKYNIKNDYISFRHHVYAKEGKEVILQEVGPRFEMTLYKLRLGTLEQTEADDEWVLRPFMNSAKKRRLL